MAKVLIKKEGCKGCGLCVLACPKKILKLSERETNKNGYYVVEMIDQSACIGCANCAVMCPDIVLEVER